MLAFEMTLTIFCHVQNSCYTYTTWLNWYEHIGADKYLVLRRLSVCSIHGSTGLPLRNQPANVRPAQSYNYLQEILIEGLCNLHRGSSMMARLFRIRFTYTLFHKPVNTYPGVADVLIQDTVTV
jgi:hypothetical protein